ncbi:carboxypeptidase-like regulatory domain-containing protein [Mucilaginibacter frigoritolerans]|nr:carboxypeptidase-like regulatory domain-containing protein [Mucilaginibacter frigoritolerans]
MLFSALCFAQNNIHGAVKDSTGKAVPFATVSLKNKASNAIVTYTVTDDKGGYNLTKPSGLNPDSLLVEVRNIGYKSQAKAIKGIAPVNFVLQASINQLQAVVIKSNRPVLRTSGDTLSYKVSDFSSPQDRVIGDVIKKLPGIAVAADGTISYNGKTISNLYIGGDNLLDDKYNIATNTVPQGVVDQVQVIQNHQPIKMLQNKVTSEDVALNLTIKKDAKLQLVGQESIGAGLPGNYDVDLNAMMFKDNYKAINYLKGNNTGEDVQNDFLSHNQSSYLQKIDNNLPATVLSLGTVNTPDLAENRYLFDQSAAVSLNNLVNLKKGEQLKVNLHYVHDTQYQNYKEQTQVYLPNDTVRYNETERNRFRPDILHGQFTLNVNKDKYYLNDILVTDYSRKTDYSGLNTNGTAVNQIFKDNTFDFSNEFNLMQPLKSNNIIEFYSYISHVGEPENRTIDPGFNPAVFNNGIPYAQLNQTVNVPTWFTNNYFSFKLPSNYFTQSYRTGFVVQSQKLVSDLDVVQSNNVINPESDSSANRLSWTRKKVYVEAAYDFPGKILKANLTLPLSLQQISYSDSLYALNKSLTKLYFDPQLHVKYMVGIENFITALYSFRNVIGNIQDVYHGYILQDYRTLYANNANLTEQKDQTAALGFNYNKALTLFFWSANVSYDHINANNITSSIISNSFQQRIVLPYQNTTDSWTANGYISKYSFALRTTFSGGILWQSNRSNQIQNNALLPYNTVAKNLNVGAETKVSSVVTFSYKAILNQTDSHSSADAPTYHIKELVQQAALNYNPSDNLLFKLSGEHYITYQNQASDLKYFFADASAKFRIEKWKTDLELSAANFLNVKNYNALYLSANTLTASSYTLPGRIVLLKVLFNL